MSISTHKTEQVKRLGKLFKLLAEPNRLKILRNLELECRPVSDIVSATGLSQTNVSFHLRALREAGLVRPERRGAFIFYCLPDAKLVSLLDDLQAWIDGHEKKGTMATEVSR